MDGDRGFPRFVQTAIRHCPTLITSAGMPRVPPGSVYVVLARPVLGRPVLPFPVLAFAVLVQILEGALPLDFLMSLVTLCVQEPPTRRKETELEA